MEQVILVDSEDNAIGTMEKMEAHEKGLLHRAFSVFLFNDQGELLLQQRASEKYHSGGLWTNTCCSHPRPEESIIEAGTRRLKEEMGINCPVEYAFKFTYKSALDHGLTEHELDHVLIGKFNGSPSINIEEVKAWKYMHPKLIREDINNHPDNYTVWFKIVFDEVMNMYQL